MSLDLPVLIYLKEDGCPACQVFDPEWEKIKAGLQGRARFVKFSCNSNLPAPGPLSKYSGWYPSIILAGPKSYFRCFTPEDQVNEDEFSPQYTIKAKKYNAVETGSGFEYNHQSNDAKSITNWFDKISPSVRQFDESAPPKRYQSQFSL